MLLWSAVVGCFTGDGHVVGMAFLHTGIRDADELGIVKVLDGGSTAVAHATAKSTDELVDDFLNGAFVRHTASDALGHKFLRILDISLEVAVLRATFHGFEPTHATIALELTSVVDDGVTRTFLCTSNE